MFADKRLFLFILGFLSLSTSAVYSQGILIDTKTNAFLILGGLSYSGDLKGSAFAAGYSFNGKTELGVVLGSLDDAEEAITTIAFVPNFLFKKQNGNDPFNLEFAPSIQLINSDMDDLRQTIFSVETALSRDISRVSKTKIIPRLSIAYSFLFSERSNQEVGGANDTFLTFGSDLNLLFELSQHFDLLVNPGIGVNLENGTTGGVVGVGFLFR